MAEDEADRLTSTIEGHRPPDMGEVTGKLAPNGSAKGKSHEERIKGLEEKNSEKPPEHPQSPPDAEDILQAAGYKVKPATEDDSGWSQTPTIKTQFVDERFISTVMPGPEITDQFDLSSSEQKAELNELKRKSAQRGAPQVQVLREETQFSEVKGSYVVLLVYRNIFYRSLIATK